MQSWLFASCANTSPITASHRKTCRKLLQHFDLDHDAEISLVEFRTMINHVMIGFTNEEASDLFESLDFQQRGLIRAASFLTIVFPREFEECKQTYVPALRKKHRIFY